MTDDIPPAEAVMALSELKQATVCPDGERVAFLYTDTGRPEIHVFDLASGHCERWTDGDAPETMVWPLAWTADGEKVLYHYGGDDGDERHDVHAVDETGDVQPVFETEGTTTLRDVGPDGDTLLVRSNHQGSMDAYRYELATDCLVRLTDRERPVWKPILAPDGERVAYPADGDIHVCDADGVVQFTIDVGDAESTSLPIDWHPDGDALLVSDDSAGVDRCGVYDLDARDVTWYGNSKYVEEPECFLPHGRRFVALRTRDARTVPVVYDTETGDCCEFSLPDGVAYFGRNSNCVVDDDRVLVTHATPTRRAAMLVYDFASNDYQTAFRPHDGPFGPNAFVSPVYERVPSNGVPATRQTALDHDPAETFDVETLFYDAGDRPSPLVVWVHGGPHQADRLTFRPYAQFFCRRGYSVLQVNYRGSTGHGRAFEHALHGDWGGAEQGDVATAVEHVLDAYDWLDSDRVAVYGGSFGGYSAYWQLVQYPDLYAAGISIVGMTDLRDMFENTVSQFRTGFLRTHLGTPDENEELYRARSPIAHVENLDAPLLMVHGRNDPRVPVSQARRFRDALLENGYVAGTDFEYEELEASGHFTGSEGVSESLALADDFLDRRL